MKGLILTALILLIAVSCKYSFSPYTVETPKLLENEAQLRRITEEEPSTPADYRIAFISDTHNYYDDLADLVKDINANGPFAFVVVTGDVTNEGLREEYLKTKEILNRLNYPVIVVVGNHDLLAEGEKIFGKLYGKKDFTLTYRNLAFVFANTNNWETGGRVPDLKFIEDSFRATALTDRILVTHVPLNDRDRFSETEINRMEDLVRTQGVDFIFSGHNHNPGVGEFGGATQITVGAPTKKKYSVLNVTAGGLSHQKISF